METKQSMNELVERLMQGSTYEMLEAAESIGRQGESAVITLAPMLRSGEREVRWRAAIALERIGSPAVGILVAAARDENFLVRVPAIWALEHIGDSRAVVPLVENLNGRNECCRWMAAAALSKIGGPAEKAAVEKAFSNDPAGREIVDEMTGRF
jgi:HEAT repeat protein